MGSMNFTLGIRYEVQDHKHGDYEIYGYRKDHRGNEHYCECWWITKGGIIFKYEVWSPTFGEFIPVPLKDKTGELYLDRIDDVREYLMIAIEDYHSVGIEEPWKMIKATIGSQM